MPFKKTVNVLNFDLNFEERWATQTVSLRVGLELLTRSYVEVTGPLNTGGAGGAKIG